MRTHSYNLYEGQRSENENNFELDSDDLDGFVVEGDRFFDLEQSHKKISPENLDYKVKIGTNSTYKDNEMSMRLSQTSGLISPVTNY